jgi:rhodanese-related sulfurtransferase
MKKSIVIILMSLFLIACSTTGEGTVQQNELLEQIKKGQAPIVIDVRSAGEYQAGHVPGAINIPFWAAFSTDKLESVSKNKKLVLYCEHGPRAGIAKLALKISGFEKISYLAGHMTAWKKAGLQMEMPK